MVAILVLSLAPPSSSMPTTGWDKSNHMLGFAVLALLSHRAWPGRTALALLALLGFGGLIEVLQSFTPDRYADFADLAADGVGLVLGEALARIARIASARKFLSVRRRPARLARRCADARTRSRPDDRPGG